MRNDVALLAIVGFVAGGITSAIAAPNNALRVCADPNNLPFSNIDRSGFENKIAELVAHDLGKSVAYTWAPQRQHFIKNTLKANKCDVVMGVPANLDSVETTVPYYTSGYVFVYRRNENIGLRSIKDPRLRKLTIGVHLIGNDDVPPELAFGQEGIIDNVVGYMIFGDDAQPNPPARLIEAVENRNVDVAAVWGPIGGYFAQRSPVALTVVPIADTQQFAPLVFSYRIAMGVRPGDDSLKGKLDSVIAAERPAIGSILQAYGIPLIENGD